MNIQIFGTRKSQDTKKAERFFKERGIRFQSVDLQEKGLSRRELESVIQSVGLEAMVDENAKDRDTVLLLKYSPKEDWEDKLLEHPGIIRQPIVRNGKKATVGNCPDVWKKWVEEG